jgi:hypothetical protein
MRRKTMRAMLRMKNDVVHRYLVLQIEVLQLGLAVYALNILTCMLPDCNRSIVAFDTYHKILSSIRFNCYCSFYIISPAGVVPIYVRL